MKRLVWLLLVPVCGCTTILGSNPQRVTVNSSPPGATVSLNGAPAGQTPTAVMLDKKQTYTLEVTRAGSTPSNVLLAKSVDPLFFVNVLFLPGFVVDLVTGTYQKYPDDVMTALVPLAASRR